MRFEVEYDETRESFTVFSNGWMSQSDYADMVADKLTDWLDEVAKAAGDD